MRRIVKIAGIFLAWALVAHVTLLGFASTAEAQDQGKVFPSDAVSVTYEDVPASGQTKGTDLFTSKQPISIQKGQMFKIHLNYDVKKYGAIEKDTPLKVELKTGYEPGVEGYFLKYPYSFASKKSLVSQEEEELAKVNLSSDRVELTLTFNELNKTFTADIDSELQVDTGTLILYFDDNPQQKELEITYTLYINDQKTDKTFTVKYAKPEPEKFKKNFAKTPGTYKRNQGQEMGKGWMFYNLNFATGLNSSNEFYIYDTPDVNLAFQGSYLSLKHMLNGHFLNDTILSVQNPTYIGKGDEATRMEAELYDIYYVTQPAASDTVPRQAEYEEKNLEFTRTKDSTTTITSKDKAAVPKNILVTKLHGEKLTPQEEQVIIKGGGA